MTSAYGANPIARWVDKDQPVTVVYKESEVYHLSLFKNQQDQPSGQRQNAQTYLVLIISVLKEFSLIVSKSNYSKPSHYGTSGRG